MRAAVTRLLPALAHHFNLTPTDVWALTLDELAEFRKALKELSRG